MKKAEFKEGVEKILKLAPGSLKDTDSRDTVETWSSFVDVEILEFIQDRTGAEADSDMMEADSYGDLVSRLQDKGLIED